MCILVTIIVENVKILWAVQSISVHCQIVFVILRGMLDSCADCIGVMTFMNKLVSSGFFWNTPMHSQAVMGVPFPVEACVTVWSQKVGKRGEKKRKERNTALNASHLGPTVVTHPFILLRRVVCLIICFSWIAGPWLAVCGSSASTSV